MQILVNSKADVNAQGGRCGNALQATSSGGNREIVQLLLDKRADGTALNAIYNRGKMGSPDEIRPQPSVHRNFGRINHALVT